MTDRTVTSVASRRRAAGIDRAAPAKRAAGAGSAPSVSETPAVAGGPDPLTIGRRLRHVRRTAGLTLDEVAADAGMSPSALSLIENGKREAKLSALAALAAALHTDLAGLLAAEAPSRRAALEIALEKSQRADSFKALGVPAVRVGPRLPTEALEALVGMHRALAAVQAERAATPEHARRANAELRERMRAAGNYFGDIEAQAATLLRAIGHRGGPITRTAVDRMAAHLGFALVHTSALPTSTRTVTDLANKRIYLPQPEAGQHDSRSLALQALGHVVLGHRVPADYGDFLAQRVEINYFAAALLIPEREAVALLSKAKAAKDIAIEDLRDAYAVSYETAAHRFTNLATRHLDLPVHFMRISSVRRHLQGVRERRCALPDRCHRRDRGPAGVPVLDGAGGLRTAGPVLSLPAVHRHGIRNLLVHRGCRPDPGRHLLGQRRRPVRPRQMDARPGDDRAVAFALPGPAVLRTAAGRPGAAVGGIAWPSAQGALASAGGHATRGVPRCRRHRGAHLPGAQAPGGNPAG